MSEFLSILAGFGGGLIIIGIMFLVENWWWDRKLRKADQVHYDQWLSRLREIQRRLKD